MQKIEILDLVIEPNSYSVYRLINGEKSPIALPKLSFTLFKYLIENAQEICTLEQISEAVWENTVVSNETITQRITLLRKALGDDPKNPKYIESIRGRGYRLIVAPTYKARKHYNRILLTSIAVFALLSLSAATYWFTQYNTQTTQVTTQEAAQVPPQAATQVTTQVPKAIQTYQSDDMNESVSAILTRGNYYFNIGQNENIDRAIELFTNVLSIEPENEEALVGLSLALSKSVCRYNQNTSRAREAHELAMKAKELNSSSVNASKAEAAIAYAWDCLGNLELAIEHYLLSIELDPQHYKSIGSAAHLLTVKGELLQAYQLSLRAKQLAPNNHMTDLQIARILELLNFKSEAQAAYRELFLLYPDNVFISEAYPRFLYFQGRFEEAKQATETVLNRNTGRYDIYLQYTELIWLLDNQATALAYIENAKKHNPSQPYAKNILRSINNQLSVEDAKLAIADIEKFVAQGDTWPNNYIEAALISLWALNDEEATLVFLQKAVKSGYLDSEYLGISPLFAPLRGKSEYQQLIGDINKSRESMRQLFLAAYPLPQS
jgi:DNA-binding winged helix-turn-helix (wHTH) protein/Tfp pilus assembly protein PilF